VNLLTLSARLKEEGLTLAMADDDPVIRRKAAEISPFYAEGLLLDALKSLVSDSNAAVQKAATEALAFRDRVSSRPN
jgi:hypothetical protein